MHETKTRSNFIVDTSEEHCCILMLSKFGFNGYPTKIHSSSLRTTLTKDELNKIELSGHVILVYVSPEEFAKRVIWPSTNGTHANRRLRTLKHWQH